MYDPNVGRLKDKIRGGGGGVVPLSIALIYIMKNMNNIKPNSKTNSS